MQKNAFLQQCKTTQDLLQPSHYLMKEVLKNKENNSNTLDPKIQLRTIGISQDEKNKLLKVVLPQGKLDANSRIAMEKNFEEDDRFLNFDTIHLTEKGVKCVYEFLTNSKLTKVCLYVAGDKMFVVFKPNDCKEGGAIKHALEVTDKDLKDLKNNFKKHVDLDALSKVGPISDLSSPKVLDAMLSSSPEAEALKNQIKKLQSKFEIIAKNRALELKDQSAMYVAIAEMLARASHAIMSRNDIDFANIKSVKVIGHGPHAAVARFASRIMTDTKLEILVDGSNPFRDLFQNKQIICSTRNGTFENRLTPEILKRCPNLSEIKAHTLTSFFQNIFDENTSFMQKIMQNWSTYIYEDTSSEILEVVRNESILSDLKEANVSLGGINDIREIASLLQNGEVYDVKFAISKALDVKQVISDIASRLYSGEALAKMIKEGFDNEDKLYDSFKNVYFQQRMDLGNPNTACLLDKIAPGPGRAIVALLCLPCMLAGMALCSTVVLSTLDHGIDASNSDKNAITAPNGEILEPWYHEDSTALQKQRHEENNRIKKTNDHLKMLEIDANANKIESVVLGYRPSQKTLNTNTKRQTLKSIELSKKNNFTDSDRETNKYEFRQEVLNKSLPGRKWILESKNS